MRMTINLMAAQVRAVRHRNGWAGRLASVVAPCTTCNAEAGNPCTATDWGGATTTIVHAARADAAATLIEAAP